MLKLPKMDRSQYVLLISYALILCAEALYFALQLMDRPKLLLLLFSLLAIGIIAAAVFFYLLKVSALKIETIFLLSMLVVGVCYIAVIGPLKSNDETSHYIGAYWLSNALLGFDMSSLPMRADDLAFYEKWRAVTLEHKDQFAQLHDGFSIFANNADLVTYAENLNKNPLNSPVQMYFFPALGLSIGRLFGLGAVPAYYLGRALALAAFSTVAYVAARNAPLGKPVFMIVGLLPMTMELSSSFSYDGPTIALALLLTSFCFKAIYAEKQAVSTLIIIATASILLVPLKVVYSSIVFLVLMIPSKTFPSKSSSMLYKTFLLIGCALTFAATRLSAALAIVESDVTSFSITGEYDTYSLFDLLEHPLWATHVFLNSFFERLDFKVFTYLGSNMGQNNLSPIGCNSVSIGFLLILLFALMSQNSTERPALKVTILCMTCIALSAFAIELTMFIGNAARGSNVIIGVLGRYFIPLTPLLIPLFANTRLSRSYPTPKALLYGALCLNMMYAIDIYGYIALAQ